MNKEFNLETKDEIKREIDHQVIRLATELKEEIDDNFNKANEKLVTQQVLINTLKDRIDKAIEFMEKMKKENDKMINFEILHDEYQHEGAEYQNALIDELLDILKGSDSNDIHN